MSEPIVEALKDGLSGNFFLFDKFVTDCPKDIWELKFGGWPIWQQFAHSLFVNIIFLPGEPKNDLLPGVSQEVATLKEIGSTPISQESAKKSLEDIKNATLQYLDKLKDSELPSVAKKMGDNDFTHAKIINLLGGHIMYHLGVFDAALREKNLQGII
jgi:hypothetical protein